MDVLVDARNVLRSRWPNVPEEELVERCRAWAHANGRCAHVIFDGRAPGALVGERRVDAACRLVGSGPESADDVIARLATAWTDAGRPFELVTSDRELRRRAGEDARSVTGGGAFLAELYDTTAPS